MSNFTMPNITSVASLTTYANVVTNNLAFSLITGLIWLVLFLATKQYSTERAFMTACFITFLVSVLFWAMHLIPGTIPVTLILATALSMFLS